MPSSPDPWQLGYSEDNPEKCPESSSLGAHKWYLPANQSWAWAMDHSGVLGSGQ